MLQWYYALLLFSSALHPPKDAVPIVTPPLAGHPAAVCDLIVDAGPDTNVCYPGGLIDLMGSISGNDVFFQWTPAIGLNNPFILTPTANITGPVTYTLIAYAPDPNNPELIINGDFTAGNTGFNSDYNYVTDMPGVQNEMVPEGTYAIINNPNNVHTGFNPCTDHTGGNGNMMVVNGAANFQDIWCQTVSVEQNSFYNVAAWVASVNSASPAQIQFSINGTPIGAIVNAVPTPCVWTPFNAIWNSGNTTSAEICILNLNTSPGGNDFAIDDISMIGLCSVADEVEITLYEEEAPEPVIEGPDFVCEGDLAVYTASFPPFPAIYNYQWVIPTGATILSGQGTPEIAVLWSQDQETTICLEIETRCEMNAACFDVTIGTLPETPLIAGSAALCPGEIITLYTAEQDPDDTYQWSLPPNVYLISGAGTNEIEIEWAAPGEAEICVAVTNQCGTTDNCTLIALYETYTTLFDTIICEGSTFEINGHQYGDGLFSGTEYFLTIHGCDSIVEVEVTEANSLTYLFTEVLCPGDSIFLEGAYQYADGSFIDSFTTSNGCDSIVLTHLTFSAFDTTWLYFTTCDSALADTIINTFMLGTCDSVVMAVTSFVPSDTTLLISYTCTPADTGTTTMPLSNIGGCDSIVISSVLLLRSDTTRLFYTSCNPADVGIEVQNLTNTVGCDSLVISTTTFSLSDSTYAVQYVCQYADTGLVVFPFVNQNGCDSLVFLSSIFGGSDTLFIENHTCIPQDSGWNYVSYLNIHSCDSIVATYTQWHPTDATFISQRSCNAQDTGIVVISLLNTAGCDSIVTIQTAFIDRDSCHIDASFDVISPVCFGDSATLSISIDTGTGPFELSIHHLNTTTHFQFPSKGLYALKLFQAGEYIFDLRDNLGQSITDTAFLSVPDEVLIDVYSPKQYNGYQLLCAGDQDGEIDIDIISPGTPPLEFVWSTGSDSTHLSHLVAGTYSVTATDANGCTASDEISLSQPDELLLDLSSNDVRCFGENNGSISIQYISGGVPPVVVSINQSDYTPELDYNDLAAGNYHIALQDQNQCTSFDTIMLVEPPEWSLDVGTDTTISFGDALILHTNIHGMPQGTLSLRWSDLDCNDCLTRNISPMTSYTLGVIGTDELGCISEDDIYITVTIDRNIYIPNIFSPNDDQLNDFFFIQANTTLMEISWMRIFDRWGNLVFEKENFPPNDPSYGWDGTMRNKHMNPGVFTYQIKALFIDGFEKIFFGDLTLLR